MAEPSSFRATVGEYKRYLEAHDLENEDQQLLIDDDIERLTLLIPDFEQQFRANYPGVELS